MPCPPCNEIVFNIYPAGGTGDPIGSIKKVFAGCGREALTEADTFTIQFPATATAVQRGNLLAAVMMVDFMYFETSKSSSSV